MTTASRKCREQERHVQLDSDFAVSHSTLHRVVFLSAMGSYVFVGAAAVAEVW